MELTFTSHPEPEPELLYTNDILAILIFVPIMLIFVAVFVIYYVKYKYFKMRQWKVTPGQKNNVDQKNLATEGDFALTVTTEKEARNIRTERAFV